MGSNRLVNTASQRLRVKRACAWLWLAAATAFTGCASQENIRDAINDINKVFKEEYEAILARNGTRTFNVSPGEAFDATNAALVRMGMVVKQQSRGLGYLTAEAPAPLPLDRSDWDRAAAIDLPKAKELMRRHVGLMAELFNFEPQGLDAVVTVTIIEARAGSDVSITIRLRETAPPKSGLPRREYPPPTATQLGLDKLWAAIDRELTAAPRKP